MDGGRCTKWPIWKGITPGKVGEGIEFCGRYVSAEIFGKRSDLKFGHVTPGRDRYDLCYNGEGHPTRRKVSSDW